MAILFLIVLCLLLYFGALRCRRGHPGLQALQGWSYAHRGLHGEGRPENSMAAFRAALDRGYGIEFDLHLLKDGNLAVIHDSKLQRTTGAQGIVEDLTTEELSHHFLEGTEETIPTFRQLLDLYAGKAPLIIELKPVGNNHSALCEAACRMMEGYEGPWCMESFDPRCIYWLKKHRPEIIRGQLSENSVRNYTHLPWILRFLLTHNLLNFLTLPDFIAYKFADRKDTPSNAICRRLYGVQGVAWTLRSQQEHDTAVAEGWLPIFERYFP